MREKIIIPLLLGFLCVYAQPKEFTINDFYKEIGRIVAEADNAIPADSDPYGFSLSLRVVTKYDGSISDIFSSELLKQHIDKVINKHNFDRFNLGKEVEFRVKEDKRVLQMSVGLSPINAGDEVMTVNINQFQITQRLKGQTVTHTVFAYAQFLISKPDNGKINGDVFFESENGQIPLNDYPFLSSGNEKKYAYQRYGPGNDDANSGMPEDLKWKPFSSATQSGFETGELTPGHYFPHIRINKCIHKYDKPVKNNKDEIIIGTKGVIRWDVDHSNDKVSRPDNVNGEVKDKVEIHTTFSTKNKLEGYILAPGENPEKWNTWKDDSAEFIKVDETKVVKSDQTVYIEPYLWVSTGGFPRKCKTVEGKYHFENLPSGVYQVYLENQKVRAKIVEICNCDKEGYENQPNMTYQQNINTEGYDIYLDYEFNFKGEVLKLKVLWENVTIALGDANTVPQRFSTMSSPSKDSVGNYLDIDKRVIQPPFTIIEYPEYFICNDEFRICSDMLAAENNPPDFIETVKSGEFLSNVVLKPDFDKDEGLYNRFTVEEYKRNITLETGETVEKGIYFTWQFRFFTMVGDDMGPEIHIEATPSFPWFEKNSEDITASTNIFSGGHVDGLVPADIIGLIHLGKNFEFSKTLRGGVKYSIRGEIENKFKKTLFPSETDW